MAIPVVEVERYPQLLAAKSQRLREQFARFSAPELEIHPSPPAHYRQRCEFRLWHEGDDLYYVMFEDDPEAPGSKRPRRMDQYAVASERINQLMPTLIDAIRDQPVLRRKLFQVEFLTTLKGEALVTLVYHRALDEEWERLARELECTLEVMIIGRSRRQRIVLTRDHVWEQLEVDGRQFHYQQVENSFTQPNARICMAMLSWAREVTADSQDGDLVELYCGNGNFTVALAENFRRVLATEISRTSVASARINLARNQITNGFIGRMSAEDFSAALKKDRQGRRVDEMALDDYHFSTVLVDPPRAGLDDLSCAQISAYERILYISCNPDSLAANLDRLIASHRIVRFGLFDQFPFTHHCECGVLLERR